MAHQATSSAQTDAGTFGRERPIEHKIRAHPKYRTGIEKRIYHKRDYRHNDDNKGVEDNNVLQNKELKDIKILEEIASLDVNDLPVLSDSELNGADEDLENEVEKLNGKERENLLKDLSNSNL